MKNFLDNAINISTLTSQGLKRGELRHILLEYYQLRKITENNPWHLNQNVFDHVVGVFQGLETVWKFNFFSSSLQQKAKLYLMQKVNKCTRKEILIVATVLHDIAKSNTIIQNAKTGTTSCPGHEMIGSFLAHEMGKRFGFSGASLTQLERIVLYHGFVHNILDLCLHRGSEQKYLKLLSDITNSVYIELLILAYADMLGSDLPRVNLREFSQRETIIRQAMKDSF